MLSDSSVIDQTKIRNWAAILATLSLVFFFVTIYPAKFYFLNDDFVHIPFAAKGNFIFGSLVRPIGDLSLWLDYKIWGRASFGYHLTNTIIHLLNAILVYFFSKSLLKLYADGRDIFLKSWVAAVIFLVYAFHSEPVLWIIGRSGSLSTFFFLIACIAYLKRNSGLPFLLISLFSFVLSLLTYESSWVFPLFVLFISYADVRLKKSKWKSERAYPLITIFLFLIFLIFLKLVAGVIFTEYSTFNFMHLDFPRLFLNYHSLIARTYLPYSSNSALFALMYCFTGVVGIGFIVLFYKKKRLTNTLWWLMIVLFLTSPLPEISLGISTHNSESERYVYLPSVFFIILLVETLSQFIRNRGVFMLITTLYIFFQCCLFYRSASAFNFAGEVVRKSLNSINIHSSVDVIYLINRPIQYKGALMFRTGFENALDWICPDLKFTRIDTIGRLSYLRESRFSIRQLNFEEGINELGYKIAERGKEIYHFNIDGKSCYFHHGKDMILCWNDSSFISVR